MSFPRHRCVSGHHRRGFGQKSAHVAQAFSRAQTSGWSLNPLRPCRSREEVDTVVWFDTYFACVACIWRKLQEKDSNRTHKCRQLSAFNKTLRCLDAKEHDNHDDSKDKLEGNQMIYHPVIKHGWLENALCVAIHRWWSSTIDDIKISI